MYVSVGGGGDKDAEARYKTLIGVANHHPDSRFVFGAGSLYLGAEWYSPNVAWTRRPLMATCFRAFDVALSAGGYNTIAELMHAGVPGVFLPQNRTHDDQGARVAQCAERGAGILPLSDSIADLSVALTHVLEPTRNKVAREAAQSLIPTNAAALAATETLTLLVDRSLLERADDVRAAFVANGAQVPEEWKEADFLRALGMLYAQRRSNDIDEDDSVNDAMRATWAACIASNEQGQSPRTFLSALRQGAAERKRDEI